MKVYLVTCTMHWLDSEETSTSNVGIFKTEETARDVIRRCAVIDEELNESYYNTYEIETYKLIE